ncbi:MAG: MOSC domain-containing protein, partial [Anaerolineae bacterium]|nr:MOSC domain-containing protein [Anaerolineae bacterium]
MTTATVVSIQVGMPAEHGADAVSKKQWRSGIFKYPVEGRIWLDTLNLAGDGQDDLDNHGGPFRAVLTYAAGHYPVWRAELGLSNFNYGAFGENFTVSELSEDSVCLGDVYAVGEALLQVSQPRFPCWKLARRNQRRDLSAHVERRGWGGWYQRVLKTGYVQAGDAYTLVERPYPDLTIALINAITSKRQVNPDACRVLAGVEALTPSWRVM